VGSDIQPIPDVQPAGARVIDFASRAPTEIAVI
jgi:hypothetical protein